jgi:hypothetical protein
MFNSYVSETNRRLYPALNKHIVTEPNDVDNDNETEPSAKKIKIRHLNVINTCIVPEAPKHVRQSDKVSENSTTHLMPTPGISLFSDFKMSNVYYADRKKCKSSAYTVKAEKEYVLKSEATFRR